MQNTRLNNLIGVTSEFLGGWLRNPWRRLSVLVISLLLGNFLGPSISLISGQSQGVDVVVAGILVLVVEVISWITYRSTPETARSLLVQIPNAIKIGLIYSLFVEAFKLGS
ncbi:DUF565 domain-containing protein [Kovacikia minuta CCNUW1]|uniref:DUF565 domain-containing protein n=1 Tax=Kovacikia minuta TaxID=2931930 RepID=UPI001CD01E8E|nr:DUF565 domain-containing protein [Kovacikia minuta]UBF24106.1 DUF565 domain-containing protein [Kovacikia minuta CCNUW1]